MRCGVVHYALCLIGGDKEEGLNWNCSQNYSDLPPPQTSGEPPPLPPHTHSHTLPRDYLLGLEGIAEAHLQRQQPQLAQLRRDCATWWCAAVAAALLGGEVAGR